MCLCVMQSKDLEQVKKFGGVSGLARLLRTSVDRGINPALEPTKEQRMAEFGNNKLREIKPKPFFQLLINNLKDPILILLMAAALVSVWLTPPYAGCQHACAWVHIPWKAHMISPAQ